MILFLNISGGELLIIFIFILMLFGSKSIPTIARSLGRGLRQVKDATNEIKKDIRESSDDVRSEWKRNNVVEEFKQEVEKKEEKRSEPTPAPESSTEPSPETAPKTEDPQ